MWYPPPQQQQHPHPHQNQQQRWLGYNQHLSSQQHQQSYSRTSYYCTSDEPSAINRTTNTYVGSRNDENETFNQYHSNRADDVYGKEDNREKCSSRKFDLHLRHRPITVPHSRNNSFLFIS